MKFVSVKNVVYLLSFCALMVTPVELCAQTKSGKSIQNKMAQRAKIITHVEKLIIESPVGCVPRLPFQVMVTYSDYSQALRQV